jgi:hypothetical protein
MLFSPAQRSVLAARQKSKFLSVTERNVKNYDILDRPPSRELSIPRTVDTFMNPMLLNGIDLSTSRKGLVLMSEFVSAFGSLEKTDRDYIAQLNGTGLYLRFNDQNVLRRLIISGRSGSSFLGLDQASPERAEQLWETLGFFKIAMPYDDTDKYYCDGCTICVRLDLALDKITEIQYCTPDEDLGGPLTREHHAIRSLGGRCPPGTRVQLRCFAEEGMAISFFRILRGRIESPAGGASYPLAWVIRFKARDMLNDDPHWVVHPLVGQGPQGLAYAGLNATALGTPRVDTMDTTVGRGLAQEVYLR